MDGFDGDAKQGGDGVVTQFVAESQIQQFAGLGVQRIHRGPHGGHVVIGVAVAGRRGVRGDVPPVQPLDPRPTAEDLGGFVAADRRQPGGESGGLLQRPQLPAGFGEGFLCGVLGQVPVAEHRPRDSDHRRVMAVTQGHKTRHIATHRRPHQKLIRSRGQIRFSPFPL